MASMMIGVLAAASAQAESNLEPLPPPPAALGPSEDLSVLLSVPGLLPTRVQETDASLANAAEAGTNPALKKKNPFRKRSVDLFRTERDIEILRQEMQLRFRVRPKTRETMSVELRF